MTVAVPQEHKPLALVSRYDPYRKGFDRIERWLLAYEGSVPRPAVKVFAPLPDASSGLLELADRGLVEWDPETRGEALTTALRSCSGAVLLSRWEGQPRALREALLMGLPVLTTAAANLTEVIDVLGSGSVVDGDDPDQIHAAFRDIGARSHDPARAEQLFDRDRIGAFLWQVFSAVSRQQTPPRSYYDTIAAR
jgi:glycosyltransferase involved in cell wall biosynthesis